MTKTELFITRSKNVHGDKYTYEKTEYVKSKSKVVITCPEHGDFKQIPNSHLNGSGCPSCGSGKKANSRRIKHDIAIQKCKDFHGDKYDYSLVNYSKVSDKVIIVCPEHGSFEQSLINHYRGRGCPRCGKLSMAEVQKLSKDDFLKKARFVHGDEYEYDLSTYENYRSKVRITCKKHGVFFQSAENHYSSGAGCPSCAVRNSKGERGIVDLIQSLGFKCQTSDRNLIKPLELDIVIPELKIAIEYNGLLWHSELYGRDKWYHHDKTKMCNEKGYRLIHIWEDEWKTNNDLQIRFLKHQLGVSDVNRLFARRCNFTSHDKKTIKEFLNKNHIQGSTHFSESVCLEHEGELVSVTCFTRRGAGFEVVRHCNSKPVIGSLGKSVKHFVKQRNCQVYTFLDKSRFAGESYEKAGFKLESEIPPDYSYMLNNVRFHKFNYRRDQIRKKHPDVYSEDLTEREMMLKAGYTRIWDCGKKKYVYDN